MNLIYINNEYPNIYVYSLLNFMTNINYIKLANLIVNIMKNNSNNTPAAIDQIAKLRYRKNSPELIGQESAHKYYIALLPELLKNHIDNPYGGNVNSRKISNKNCAANKHLKKNRKNR